MAKKYENDLLEKIIERIKKLEWYDFPLEEESYTPKHEIRKLLAYIEGLDDGLRESTV